MKEQKVIFFLAFSLLCICKVFLVPAKEKKYITRESRCPEMERRLQKNFRLLFIERKYLCNYRWSVRCGIAWSFVDNASLGNLPGVTY